MSDQIVQTVGFYVSLLLESVGQYTRGLLDSLAGYLAQAFSSVYDWIANNFTAIVQNLALWTQQVETALGDVLNTLSLTLDRLFNNLTEVTVRVVDTIGNFVSDVYGRLEAIAGTIVAQVTSVVDGAIGYLVSVTQSALSAIAGLAQSLAAGIDNVLTGILQAIADAIRRTSDLVTAAWQQLVTGAEAIINTVNARIGDLAGAFEESFTGLAASVLDIGDEALKPLKDAVKRFVETFVPDHDPATLARMSAALEGIHTDPTSMGQFRAFWQNEWKSLADGGVVRQTVFYFAFLLLSLIPSVMGISNVLAQQAIQEYSTLNPYQLLGPVDATAAWRRGLLEESEAVEDIKRGGYTDRQAHMMLRFSSVVPPEAELLAFWLRGIIDDSTLNESMHQRGYDPEWIGRFRQASMLIPPVQDLITMAVREAFSPDVASRFGQFEDFPKPFADWSEKQGLSREWAERYWAAHWALPSPQQGFEMLHRGVIGQDDLNLLLRALDVMPFWRERLTQIAYSPYTRVDVRRMHKLGILTEEQVFRAHLDLGYDEEKARNLTDFVIALNSGAAPENEDELGKLSRTSILGFYSDGLITRPKATELLVTAGFTPEAAALYLNAEDAGVERAERKAAVDSLIEQATAGTITFAEAQDKMRSLGLETIEVERATTRLLRAEQTKVRIPTQAQGESFMLSGIIPERDYRDLLSRHGYSPKWIDAFVREAQIKAAKRGK